MSSIMIAAPASGSGKTTITMGILAALCQMGMKVRPFKVGPDYIDTAYHAKICNCKAINLDVYLTGENEVKDIFCQYSDGDISVIEGVMGLYDGLGNTTFSSSAHVARLISTPIVLVLSAKGMAASVSALIKGFIDYEGANIKGVIFNNVSSTSHYDMLKGAAEKVGVASLGYFPSDSSIAITSRHLGITPQYELDDLENTIKRIADIAANHVDIAALLEIANSAPTVQSNSNNIKKIGDCTIAVAMDKAINFYYADNFHILEQLGAKLKYFSPLKDDLPQCDGVYIGGGFPEIFASELADNKALLEKLKQKADEGMPIYAECGGYMYLTQWISMGKTHKMCGIFEGGAELGKKLSGNFGYIKAELLDDCLIGKKGQTYKAHEFHHSSMDDEMGVYRATKQSTGKTWDGGCQKGNAYGGYAHVYFRGNSALAENFTKKCIEFSTLKNK